jgi:hypothetical protein
MIIPNPDHSNEHALMPGAPPNGAEQRRHPRELRRVAVDFLNMGDDPRIPFYQDFVPGETEDVSVGGLRVRASYDVHEGAELGIILRSEDRFHVFLGRVVWKMYADSVCIYGLSVPRLEDIHLPKRIHF